MTAAVGPSAAHFGPRPAGLYAEPMTAELPPQLLDDLAPLCRSRGVLLIGEIHGTEQFPRLVAELAATAATDELAVTIGLEIPCSEQERLDHLVNRDPAHRQTVAPQVEGWWWERSSEFQDGRSSRAMAELVVTLAALADQGADMTVVALDGPWVAPGSPVPLELLGSLEQDRDEGMAARLLDVIDRRPRAFTVVLAGKEHTRVSQGLEGDGQESRGGSGSGTVRPMGSFVRAWHRDLVALNGRWSDGSAWMLTTDRPDPGVYALSDVDLPAGAQWAEQPGDDGHHGYVHVGEITAATPHRVRE